MTYLDVHRSVHCQDNVHLPIPTPSKEEIGEKSWRPNNQYQTQNLEKEHQKAFGPTYKALSWLLEEWDCLKLQGKTEPDTILMPPVTAKMTSGSLLLPHVLPPGKTVWVPQSQDVTPTQRLRGSLDKGIRDLGLSMCKWVQALKAQFCSLLIALLGAWAAFNNPPLALLGSPSSSSRKDFAT